MKIPSIINAAFALASLSFPLLSPITVNAAPINDGTQTAISNTKESSKRTDIGYAYYDPDLFTECQKYKKKQSYTPVGDPYARLSPVPGHDASMGDPPEKDWCECIFDANLEKALEFSTQPNVALVYEAREQKIKSKHDTVLFTGPVENGIPHAIVFEQVFKDLDIQVQCHERHTATDIISYDEWPVKDWPKDSKTGKKIPVRAPMTLV
ncbi:hypothetical protein C8R42DRAFT_661890 [Lentinula raphanica]|nr:hypothetical protein C8R42DRAFT_661890 [Lentinula raphanica]KAJ3825077.1 hypothetical protein F5880DRAFT_1555279 [Lentinula raphanica]